jgi:hypothetical protein
MLGVPIDGPTYMFSDNQAVVLNTTVPSSMLKKKHNAIAYHRVREAIAGGIVKLIHISTQNNHADCLTKPLPREPFFRCINDLLFRNLPSGQDGIDSSGKDELNNSTAVTGDKGNEEAIHLMGESA